MTDAEIEGLVDAYGEQCDRWRSDEPEALAAKRALLAAFAELRKERDEAVDRWRRDHGDRSALHPLFDGAAASRTEETPAGPVCTWDVRVICPVPADVAIDCSTSCPLSRRAAEPNGSAEGGGDGAR